MKKNIVRSMLLVALLCVLLCYLCVIGVFYKFSYDSMKTMIRDETVYLAASLNSGSSAVLDASQSTFSRVTLIDPDGTVIFDSLEDPSGMENHRNRPEVAGALQTGAAESSRYSRTLAVDSYYRAVRLQNGQVLRVAGDADSAWLVALRFMPLLALAALAAMLLATGSAWLLAKRIAAPINSIDLEKPLSNEVYEELSPLLRRMEQQHAEIKEQVALLEERRLEFDAITDNMREGLILLNAEAEVVSINRSALHTLDERVEESVGKHIRSIRRDEGLQRVVERGLRGEAGEAGLSIAGRQYQILCNPVAHDTQIQGVVLLLLDITDQYQSEQMRREFTANVSHELKTPLTSISGFAEIIRFGVAKPEDIPQFAERIYNETQRLVALVDDILRLSRLDEYDGSAEMRPVDMPALLEQIVERFRPPASEKGVELELHCEQGIVLVAIPSILEEIAGNLTDNAIKYNREGGRVTIRLNRQEDSVRLSVSDTGIGVPREHWERIFERFYRVDKSHSKETGGTGLGLSIVKHGAMIHHARIELESEVGVGTTIHLTFPIQ